MKLLMNSSNIVFTILNNCKINLELFKIVKFNNFYNYFKNFYNYFNNFLNNSKISLELFKTIKFYNFK